MVSESPPSRLNVVLVAVGTLYSIVKIIFIEVIRLLNITLDGHALSYLDQLNLS